MVESEARAPFGKRVLRLGVAEILSRRHLPLEVYHNPATERRLHELMRQDYGIIEVTNHWGMMEIPSVVEFNYLNRDLKGARMLIPYSAEHYSEKHAQLGKWLATKLSATATRDSDKYYRENQDEKPPENYSELNGVYIRNAVRLLSRGGVVLFSPQGGRENKLPRKFQKPMTATFLLKAQDEGLDLDRTAFLFIGTGLKGIDDLEPWHKTRWSTPHPPVQINVGRMYTFEETGLKGRILTKADAWARNELAEVVPHSYLPKENPN